MGTNTEFETRNGRKWETIRYKIRHFSTKNWEKQGKNTKKQVKKHKKKHRKLQEIQKRGFDDVPGNAENRNEFSPRFWEMLKTETETRSSQMSRNDDSRAKTMYRPTPTLQQQCLWRKHLLQIVVSHENSSRWRFETLHLIILPSKLWFMRSASNQYLNNGA